MWHGVAWSQCFWHGFCWCGLCQTNRNIASAEVLYGECSMYSVGVGSHQLVRDVLDGCSMLLVGATCH